MKSILKCNDKDKNKFKTSRCLLTISVGQEAHENEKLLSTIKTVNDSFFSCILLVDDSLQRHTMALCSDKNADYFYESSIKCGDEWLKRNAKYLHELYILEDIIRWDKWITHKNYIEKRNHIEWLLSSDAQYKKSFEDAIEIFLNRYTKRLENDLSFDLNRSHDLCLDYLIEECSSLCLWPELECHFEVYPGQRNLAMRDTHRRFVLDLYPNLLHEVYVKFKGRSQFKPQCFKEVNMRDINICATN